MIENSAPTHGPPESLYPRDINVGDWILLSDGHLYDDTITPDAFWATVTSIATIGPGWYGIGCNAKGETLDAGGAANVKRIVRKPVTKEV